MNPGINTRRSAFENYSSNAQSLSLAGTAPNSGVPELQEIAKENSSVKRSMAIYGWHQGHKVFATDDMSGLKLVANAGSMTYRGQHWRTCVVRKCCHRTAEGNYVEILQPKIQIYLLSVVLISNRPRTSVGLAAPKKRRRWQPSASSSPGGRFR